MIENKLFVSARKISDATFYRYNNSTRPKIKVCISEFMCISDKFTLI